MALPNGIPASVDSRSEIPAKGYSPVSLFLQLALHPAVEVVLDLFNNAGGHAGDQESRL